MNAGDSSHHLLGVVQVALSREASLIDSAQSRRRDAPQIVVSGMGAARARSAARLAIARGARSLIAVGYAGALREPLAIGDLLVPGELCDQRGRSYTLDSALQGTLVDALRGEFVIRRSRLLSADALVHEAAHKAALAQRFDADAVDMESVAVAREASASGIPFAVLRVVSDGPTQPVARCLEGAVDGLGRVLVARLVFALALRPLEIVHLAQLAMSTRRAGRTLQRAWRLILERVESTENRA